MISTLQLTLAVSGYNITIWFLQDVTFASYQSQLLSAVLSDLKIPLWYRYVVVRTCIAIKLISNPDC